VKKIFYILILLFNIVYSDIHYGYLKEVEMSFCMDECSQYFIEPENGPGQGSPINVIFNDNFSNIDLYLDRYVVVEIGQEINCVECNAFEVEEINLSDDCLLPVSCLADPCLVASPCELNTPVTCEPVYCGGCYADFYDLDNNLVDCYNDNDCTDVGNVQFGMCDMYLGIGLVDGECDYVSGCGWVIDGIDYSNAFYNSFSECEEDCIEEDYSCEEIEFIYNELYTNTYNYCEQDNDCISVWGDCGVGLGGCHYAINESLFNQDEINEWVDLWNENDCMQWVCDCFDLPYAECNLGQCELTYCIESNPAGCQNTGCDDGFECIIDVNDCIPSSCWCEEFTGNWICTEDCGGGACSPILYGDINFDSFINVSDVVLLINIILNPDINEYNQIADIDLNLEVNILDVVLIVNMILANY